MGYCLFHLRWSCLLGLATPTVVVLFDASIVLLDIGSYKLLLQRSYKLPHNSYSQGKKIA